MWEILLVRIGIKMRRRSSGVLVARCVFHNEHSPSLHFWVSGNFLCHGCDEQGDMAKFIGLYFGMSREEAVMEVLKGIRVQLANESQLELPFVR
jgi:DNA primase